MVELFVPRGIPFAVLRAVAILGSRARGAEIQAFLERNADRYLAQLRSTSPFSGYRTVGWCNLATKLHIREPQAEEPIAAVSIHSRRRAYGHSKRG